ncbi:MAG: multidrug efflux RND transporter permease subunit [Gammaproteobacteria bacterium]|uniref:multidrug efflux RND transporter permease subunit n=1 Tax=Stutzerimonas xanthomarina TaxID=271420 RepID=UPI000E920852|nr:multidrug efflux RND transporter permease subunit [Stutzerimonas xanthomarina]MBU1302058.1 multidrug efflux RND transporter permease subunit [Gammaproteobacteria bacterium]HAW26274.1 hydrophobe/amphiphile efflux-1 family RND transporter [Pseudomonas sp.]MBK3848244.1 multidrug efflux RND transporter permease subunit [Stutzerimonas xanthomarina]MBU1460597.1 multidrug efflux RND transporter permease subunit [Gammaproteobacteria bacterium]MBU2281624.1 multidrug efflux RND transporter permease s
MTPAFFIRRPVFAWVIALGILLGGVLALRSLPVEQYPSIAPPALRIGVTYPGADASVLETNVTQVIEQELNGVEGFLYMDSSSRSNGSASIELTFEAGTDIDIAQMEVQNRLSRVEQRLPEEVRRQGIQVFQASRDFLLIISLFSENGTMSTLELGHFATTRVLDELRRVQGVGDIREFYTAYAMRIWLNPDRLASFGLSAADVLAAVQEQNSQSAGGALGDLPLAEGIEINAPLETRGRFSTPEEFASIILRATPDGSAIRLRDVARVELGAQNYTSRSELNGQPAAGLAVQLSPGANALDTAAAVKQRMRELAEGFPEDIAWTVPFDSTPFISSSIQQVVVTLLQAMALVVLVMLLFLQNWRTTVIPTIVIPITLAGTCLGLWIAGFSINLLSLFGMVLAIGTLVDDAIVVVENVKRIMDEEQLPPYQATVKAMEQVTAPIIGTTVALIAVFVPLAFFPGSTGGIYRQFAVTLSIAVATSTVLALVLTPALCAALLKPSQPDDGKPGLSQRIFGPFNRWMERTTDRYHHAVGGMLARPLWFLLAFVGLLALTAFLYLRMPSAFLPDEDQGSLMTVIQAPAGATIERTEEAVEQVKAFYAEHPLVEDAITVYGFSFFGQGQAHAMSFVRLIPWDQRTEDGSSAQALVREAMGRFSQIKEARVFALNPPSIPGLGVAGGFTFKLEDRGGAGYQALLNARNQLLGKASESPVLQNARPEGADDAPRLRVNIDRIKARALGLSINEVNATLAIAFGSAYANDFNRDGRVLQVLLQAEAPYRMTPQDVLDLKVINDQGESVPFGAFTTVDWTEGPTQLQRYNGYPALTLSGSAAPGSTTGEAMTEMERLASELPGSFSYEWTGASLEEQQASGQVGLLLGLSLLVVLMVLAALYESWTVPIAVLLVVPFGALGAVLFAMIRDLPADVYFNVGLVTIIGLSAKNAILIVEFAIEEEGHGKNLTDAVMNAVRLRFRPILMTSLTFILGMLPLVLSTGAGAAGRVAVGTGVMGGMIVATLLGLFYIPLFYLSVRRWLTKRRPPTAEDKAHPAEEKEAPDNA